MRDVHHSLRIVSISQTTIVHWLTHISMEMEKSDMWQSNDIHDLYQRNEYSCEIEYRFKHISCDKYIIRLLRGAPRSHHQTYWIMKWTELLLKTLLFTHDAKTSKYGLKIVVGVRMGDTLPVKINVLHPIFRFKSHLLVI